MEKNNRGIKKKIMYIVGGSVLTEDFFMKNARFIITLFIIIVLYISNRYSCIEKISEVEKLQRELKDAKYESLTISSKLISVSRETKVLDMVEKKGLGLEKPREPLYKVKK